MLPTIRRLFLLTLITLGTVPVSSRAELITLFVPPSSPSGISDPIILAAGDLIEMEYANNTFTMEVTIAGQATNISGSGSSSYTLTVPKIMGPAEIRIFGSTYQPYLATFKITRANAAPSTVPSTAVVIPNDAEGQYEVLLESSTDMITWTSAQPGTYGGDTVKRFFRTRIVKNP